MTIFGRQSIINPMNVDNQTPFAAEAHGILDENGRNLLLVLLKATWEFEARGKLTLAEEQQIIELADQYYGEFGLSSLKYASDFSFKKPGTDIVLNGHAYAPEKHTREMLVSLQVGQLKKTIKVMGNRYWVNTGGVTSPSRPQPFDKIAITWENAYGGTDLSHPEPKNHAREARNPVGKGFRAPKSRLPLENQPLPNLEDPRKSITAPEDQPAPACFAAIGPAWAPRLQHAGTYGDTWEKTRKPLLPADFDFRFFNVAHPDLVTSKRLLGNEPVLLKGLTPEGIAQFALPGIQPHCRVVYKSGEPKDIKLNLDKLVINTDDKNCVILWSGSQLIPGDFFDIEVVRFTDRANY